MINSRQKVKILRTIVKIIIRKRKHIRQRHSFTKKKKNTSLINARKI